MYKKVLLTIAIVLLVFGNIYLSTKTEKLDYDITVGIPVRGEDGSVASNFLNAKPVLDKSESNSLIFYFMDATSIDKPEICENLPNLVIKFNDSKDGIQYYKVNVWIDGNSLIIGTTGEQPKYKIIDNGREEEILKIIEKYRVENRY